MEASIVFHRYHEANETKIKRPTYENGKWEMGEEGETVKNITGFDANAFENWKSLPTLLVHSS